MIKIYLEDLDSQPQLMYEIPLKMSLESTLLELWCICSALQSLHCTPRRNSLIASSEITGPF